MELLEIMLNNCLFLSMKGCTKTRRSGYGLISISTNLVRTGLASTLKKYVYAVFGKVKKDSSITVSSSNLLSNSSGTLQEKTVVSTF